jgi:predicted Zn finger-like uncharacterized protein
MFTSCPACRTVFHITAAELRAAEGTVICGACGETFDALVSLSETRPADPPAQALAQPVQNTIGEAEVEDQARDEEAFLQEVESLIGSEGPETDLSAETFLSFKLSPAPPLDPVTPDDDAAPAEESVPGRDEPEDQDQLGDLREMDELVELHEPGNLDELDDLDDLIPDPDSVFRVDEPDEAPSSAQPDAAAEAREAAEAESGTAAPIPAPIRTGTDVPAIVPAPRDDGAAGPDLIAAPGDADETVPEFADSQPRGGLWRRLLLAGLVVVVLAGTWLHTQRGQLLRHPAGESLLAPIYRLLGVEVAPEWSLTELRVVRSEAVATADQPDKLQIAVQFHNAASFAQPYPVIRVALQDRFGRPLGSHDFLPAQYLREVPDTHRMPAGSQLQAMLTVPDPAARADGFRVSLCLDLPGRGLVCTAEPFR